MAVAIPVVGTDGIGGHLGELARELLGAGEAMAIRVIPENGGFMLDTGWMWVLRGQWLTRAQGTDMLRIEQRLPSALEALWPDAPPTTPTTQRRVRTRILAIGGAVVVGLIGAGVGAWRLTGEIELLTAGLSFAGLVAVSVVLGLILGKRLQR